MMLSVELRLASQLFVELRLASQLFVRARRLVGFGGVVHGQGQSHGGGRDDHAVVWIGRAVGSAVAVGGHPLKAGWGVHPLTCGYGWVRCRGWSCSLGGGRLDRGEHRTRP